MSKDAQSFMHYIATTLVDFLSISPFTGFVPTGQQTTELFDIGYGNVPYCQ